MQFCGEQLTVKMQVLLQQPREAPTALCNEHQPKRQMQNAKLLKWATAKTVKLQRWKINDAIPVKSKEITGAVLKSHEVSLPFPFSIISLSLSEQIVMSSLLTYSCLLIHRNPTIVVASQSTSTFHVLLGFPSEALAYSKLFFRKFGLHSWNSNDQFKLKCLFLNTSHFVQTELLLISEKNPLNWAAGFS